MNPLGWNLSYMFQCLKQSEIKNSMKKCLRFEKVDVSPTSGEKIFDINLKRLLREFKSDLELWDLREHSRTFSIANSLPGALTQRKRRSV